MKQIRMKEFQWMFGGSSDIDLSISSQFNRWMEGNELDIHILDVQFYAKKTDGRPIETMFIMYEEHKL